MFIAHLPVGYIVSSLAHDHCASDAHLSRQQFLACGLLGSIFPDFDLFYFYFVDHQQFHHHGYWTHLPIFWLLSFAVFGSFCHFAKWRTAMIGLSIFAINGFLHLLLDSIVGDIRWLYPWSDTAFALFTVPALHQPWWLNFILHWSFAVEISLTITAIILLYKRKIIK